MVKIDVETQFKKSLVTWSRKGGSEQTLNFAWPNTLRKLHRFLSSSVSDDCILCSQNSEYCFLASAPSRTSPTTSALSVPDSP